MEIGFIGLGNMGRGMAANLLKAGHRVSVYNRSPAKAEALVREGATAARTIAEACGGDVVLTMLADDAAAENVTFGDDGIVASVAPHAGGNGRRTPGLVGGLHAGRPRRGWGLRPLRVARRRRTRVPASRSSPDRAAR